MFILASCSCHHLYEYMKNSVSHLFIHRLIHSSLIRIRFKLQVIFFQLIKERGKSYFTAFQFTRIKKSKECNNNVKIPKYYHDLKHKQNHILPSYIE